MQNQKRQNFRENVKLSTPTGKRRDPQVYCFMD